MILSAKVYRKKLLENIETKKKLYLSKISIENDQNKKYYYYEKISVNLSSN